MVNEKKLDAVLLELGHDDFVCGTEYIREAVRRYKPGIAIVKDLYANIGVSPSRTERSIRHSIEKAWMRSTYEVHEKYFGSSISMDSGLPRASEYIARLARICAEGGEQ